MCTWNDRTWCQWRRNAFESGGDGPERKGGTDPARIFLVVPLHFFGSKSASKNVGGKNPESTNEYTKFGQVIIKIIANRRHILRLKCTKFIAGLSLCPFGRLRLEVDTMCVDAECTTYAIFSLRKQTDNSTKF